MADQLLGAWIRPLALDPIEFPPFEANEVGADDLVRFLVDYRESVEPESLATRCRDLVGAGQDELVMAPAHPVVLDNIVWPLKNAKAAFIIGAYTTSVSVSGQVGESLGWLAREVHAHDERSPSLRAFGQLKHVNRINRLKALGFIDSDLADDLHDLRKMRNAAVHGWDLDRGEMRTNAIRAYRIAVSCSRRLMVQGFRDGKLILVPSFFEFLRRHGMVRSGQ